MIQLKPVFDKDGKPILFDMYTNGVWRGSRRTGEQCLAFLMWLSGLEWAPHYTLIRPTGE